MKKNKNITTAALLFPLMSLAQSFTQEQAQSVLQNKLGATKLHESGVQIRPVSKEQINEAIRKLGGNATVQFSDQESMKFRASSGVIIGNGGSGLVATSSSDNSGPIVVQPPLIPKTSITVVGKLHKSQGEHFCALKYKMDSTGTKILPGIGFEELKNYCAKVGQPLRIQKQGLYLIYIPIRGKNSGVIFISNSTHVHIQSGENKILPLQEINVPKQSRSLYYELYSELTSPQGLENFYRSIIPNMRLYFNSNEVDTEEEFKKLENDNIDIKKLCIASDNGIDCDGKVLGKANTSLTYQFGGTKDSSTLPSDHRGHFITFFNTLTGSATDGESISVFPGSYTIEWNIDGQKDFTTGIVVE